MSLFVAVRVNEDRCRSGQPCTACVSVCPVSIFQGRGGLAGVVEENEDECTLCDLCLERCPTDAITVRTLYTDEIRTGETVKPR
jgi:NAD-dependent dihydropyrimidine dehydrogenase PreA subunit